MTNKMQASDADIWHSEDGVEWMLATANAPYGNRIAAAVVVFGGKLWLMGGYTSSTNEPPEQGYPEYTTFNDVWCSVDGVHWTRVLEQAPWSTRMWFIAKEYGGRMWIVGGYDNKHAKNFGDVWYSEDGVRWQSFACATTFSPRHEPTCYVYDETLWVVAGNSWPVQNDVWCLRPAPSA